jgi:DNA-binding transcriptional MocR family regulator
MKPNWTSPATQDVHPRALVQLLGDWSSSTGPLYRRLAERLQVAVNRGELAPGTRLPPERILARALAVSRTTVVGAYDQLREQAILESRQGSGTWVARAEDDADDAGQPRAGTSPPRPTALRGMIGGASGTLELLGAHLPCVEDVFASALAACREDLLELMRQPGYFPLGVPALRRNIAQFLTRSGLPTREDQLMVTTGAQQATSLTATSFLQPGDTVVVEDPTYVGAIDAFRTVGARIVSVRVGPDGVPPAALREAVVRHGARLVYLMPNYQNPTGALMPETRRRDIARMSEELQVPVLEDNTLGDIVFGAAPPPPIGAFTKDGPVMSIGSMSKLFWAGLRVGWIRAGEAAIARLVQQKVVADMGSSVPSQCVAAHVLAQSENVRQLRREQVGHTLDVILDLVDEHLPGWTYTRPQGGLVLWLRMPHGDATELAQVAVRHGVSIVPGAWTSPDGGWTDHVRIPLVGEDAFLRDAFERLGGAWLAYTSGTRRPREMGVMV